MKAQSPSKEGKKSRSAPRRGSLEKTEPICLELDLCSELLVCAPAGLSFRSSRPPRRRRENNMRYLRRC